MRIISGTHKGRKIRPPKKIPSRPTTDRSKEALFNILNNLFEWSNIIVLDLFSGTGSISFEFASRGVNSITAVDQNKTCIDFIDQTCLDFNFNIKTHKIKALDFLKQNSNKFNIVFLDPPYDYNTSDYEKIISKIILKNIYNDGLVIVEHSNKINFKKMIGFTEERKYGSNCFSFFKYKAGL